MSNDPSAGTLFDNAKSYTAAASLLMTNDDVDAALAPAFYLLICFALELLLKAVCMRGGKSPRDTEKLRHDLRKAYKCAAETGMVPKFMTPLGRLVLALDDQHKNHVFRYTPDVPHLIVPPPSHCIDVLNEALAALAPGP